MNNIDVIGCLFSYGADGSVLNKNGSKAEHIGSSSTKKLIQAYEITRMEGRNLEVFKNVRLKDILRNELIGQELAIDEVSNAITRMETGWTNDKHPLVLLFVGATGLGKTEMAKLIAKYLRGSSKDAFLHVNLAEYNTEHEAAKFLGAPPGYAGYSSSQEGQLISILRKNQRAVVLFDEADKAHPNVLTTLLQLFDEGRLTSGSGKTVECKEAVFIMTANLAVEQIKSFGKLLHEEDYDKAAGNCANSTTTRLKYVDEFKKSLLHGPLKNAFKRDELLGRVNELAVFVPFSNSERKQVIEHQLNRVKKLAATRHGVTLTWQRPVLDILEKAFCETYGVRYIKHEIDRQIVTKLSQAQQAGLYSPGDFIHLEVNTLQGSDKSKLTDGLINLYKLSPLGRKEHLDIQFAELSDIFKLTRC